VSATCQTTHAWMSLQGAEEPSLEGSARHAAHVAECADCQALLHRYEDLVLTAQGGLTFAPSEGAADHFVARASQRDEQSNPWLESLPAALDFSPSEAGAATFMAAARQHTSSPGDAPSKRGGSWAMLAAAAGLLVALALWGTREHTPETRVAQGAASTIEITQRSGSTWVNGALIAEGTQGLEAHAAQIVTGEASDLTLQDDSGDVVTLSSRSEVKVEDWRRSSRRIALRTGSVRAKVSHRSANERFEVLTPNARVIVVGTEFTVTYSEALETVVRGDSGTVRVEGLDGTLLGLVRAGDVLRIPPKVAQLSAPTAPRLEAPRDDPSAAPTALTLMGQPEAPSPPQALVNKSTPVRAKRAVRDEATPTEEAVAEAPKPPPVAPKPAPEAPESTTPTAPPLQQARTWLGEGKEAKAIALLEATVSPDWRRDALLGDAYQLKGQFKRALEAYRVALTKTARPPAPLLADMASLWARRLKRPAEAEKAWERYLELYPQGSDAAKALLYLADHARTTGRSDEASQRYLALLERFPHKAQASKAFTRLGSALLRGKRWGEAEALFAPHMLAGTSAKAEVALVGMIRVRIAQGQRDNAARLITRYQIRFPEGKRGAEVQRLNAALRLPKEENP
jgi:tetratricopeptide (TPR) repeat protein